MIVNKIEMNNFAVNVLGQLSEGYEEDEKDKWNKLELFETILNKKLDESKKGRMWWKAPSGIAANSTLMGDINLWRFTVLGSAARFSLKKLIVPSNPNRGLNSDALVCNFGWTTYEDGFRLPVGVIAKDPEKYANDIIKIIKGGPSLTKIINVEIDNVEKATGKKVPESIVKVLIAEAPKVAQRRMGANIVKSKSTVVPFDGSKPFQVSNLWSVL